MTASAFCTILPSEAPCSVNIPSGQPKSLHISLPLALIDLDKLLLDGLQIWADQITQYFGPKDACDEAVIGSKFFGKSMYVKKSMLRRRGISSENSSSSELASDSKVNLDCQIQVEKGMPL